jgi:hypothetical protein
MAEDCIQWWASVLAVSNLWVLNKKVSEYLFIWFFNNTVSITPKDHKYGTNIHL